MEEESRSQEPFLKIERTWSEAEQNFDNITVKEEDISDVEPETLLKELEENNCSYIVPSDKCGQENDARTKDSLEEGTVSTIDVNTNKKGKSRGNGIDLNATCLHDAKNFKVVKKRLRCSDCKSILCPECYCTINSSLQTHFSKSDNNSRRLYPCKLCSMIFKANCALQAHIRIHLLDTPYVCPDCGAIYNNIYFLSLHLINKCYHVYKVVTNGCKLCLSQNMSPDDYICHIEKYHIKPVYKCSQCGLIFENTTDMNRHLGSSHKNESVMPLSYFSCSMCGTLKISKHLYAKHIKYHREHTATFQIGYLCSCGHSFNTACSFRTHFKNCSKKGILPPQWTYLQVTLKTHEMLQVQSAVQKSTFLQSESGSVSNPPESGNDSVIENRELDYSLFEDGDSSEEFEEPREGSIRDSSHDSEIYKSKSGQEDGRRTEPDNSVSGEGIESNVSTGNEKDKAGNYEELTGTAEGRSESVEVDCTRMSQEEVVEISSEQGTIANKEEVIREKTSNVQIIEESRDGNSLRVHPERGKGSENDDNTLKVIYDHIPCDHLGYLKTQQSSELQVKSPRKNGIENTRNCELSDNPLVTNSDNYIITSVLDEKTGVMRTRKVFIQKNPSGQVEGDGMCNSEISESQNRELQKSRSGTFFSCPFCTVLFPKHFSSFHRFRLHLEYYHPEAALDITVDRTQLPKSQMPFSSIKIHENDVDSDGDERDLDDVDLQTRLNSLKESNREEDSRNAHLQTSESSNDGSLQGELARREKKKKGSTAPVRRSGFDMKLRSRRSTETGNDEEFRNRSNTKESQNRKNSFSKKINENFRSALNQNVDHLRIANYAEDSCDSKEPGVPSTSARSIDDVDENSESMDSEICNSYNKATKLKDDCDNELGQSESKDGNVLKITPKNARVSEDSLSDDRGTNDFQDYTDEKESSQREESKGVSSKSGRERNRSNAEECEAENVKDEKGGQSPERRNSRRESDVWSEFYKTLKIAETLKKTKAKNQESEDAPILTNYANKRVVKKPKRYRESSDSEESNEGEPEDEELYSKKQKLLNRLENVDYRILDYVIKILERKQKNSGASKRIIDSKGTIKKLINGGKISVKQQKTGLDFDEGEGENSDLNGDELDWESQTVEEKGDKRRGRPRKSDPFAGTKERRRSDHEERNHDGEDEEFYTKKKKRKLSNKLQYFKKMLEKKDFSSGQVISTMKNSDSERKLTCAVCKESHQTESEFREHIQTHRMDESSHQCMECGECFVVRPSLEKHLHAFHKIKDVRKYIEENDCSSTLDQIEEVESEPLKENQCKVCKDQFETVHDLNKHFRIHGMAFLRQFKKEPKSN